MACVLPAPATGEDVKQTDIYARLKQAIDAVPAIDTHEHLQPFNEIPYRVETPQGHGMTL